MSALTVSLTSGYIICPFNWFLIMSVDGSRADTDVSDYLWVAEIEKAAYLQKEKERIGKR